MGLKKQLSLEHIIRVTKQYVRSVIDGTESGFDVRIRKQPMKGAVEKRVKSTAVQCMKVKWLIIVTIIVYYSEVKDFELVFK